jgi:uncharacterized protein YcaQ
MSSMPLSPAQWVQLNLQQQGLHQSRRGKAATLAIIEQLGYVQIDSINVVERAHHHVLQSRIANYQPQWLDELMAERKIFEYWSHAAAYLPMQDFRFSLFRKQQLQQGKKHWFAPDHQMMQLVRARITAEGPLKASDFTATAAKNGPWWDWQPAKQALEQLFMHGELMVLRREKFQKVFELTERILPAGLDLRVPTLDEFVGHLITRYLQSHGCGSAAQISYLRAGLKPEVQQQLLARQAGGELGSFIRQGQRYFYPENLPELAPLSHKVRLLNPFDNLLIQRQRLQHWFDFDYQIEVYVPAEKRKIGYYSLPVLYRQQLIGQMDVKAVRAEKVLLVQHLVLSEATRLTAGLRQALTEALDDYAVFNRCDQWQLVKATPKIVAWLSSGGH